MRYFAIDFNKAGICSRDTHLFCDAHGIDFYKFVREGFTLSELLEIQNKTPHPELERFINEVKDHGK